jgi:endonuclease G, mitochondrial
VWVIYGPIFDTLPPDEWIGDEGEVEVAVPTHFYQIIVKDSGNSGRPDVLAFIYPHDETLSSSAGNVDHTPYLKSVKEVEDRTGLDFFTSLSSVNQRAIESEALDELWPIEVTDDVRTFSSNRGRGRRLFGRLRRR